jgi:hypothetical protein
MHTEMFVMHTRMHIFVIFNIVNARKRKSKFNRTLILHPRPIALLRCSRLHGSLKTSMNWHGASQEQPIRGLGWGCGKQKNETNMSPLPTKHQNHSRLMESYRHSTLSIVQWNVMRHRGTWKRPPYKSPAVHVNHCTYKDTTVNNEIIVVVIAGHRVHITKQSKMFSK